MPAIANAGVNTRRITRKDGSTVIKYEAWYWEVHASGARFRRRKLWPTKGGAEAFLRDVRIAAHEGTYSLKPKDMPTLAAFIERYERDGLVGMRANSRDRNTRGIRKFVEFIGRGGKRPLDAITPAEIEGFKAAQLRMTSRYGTPLKGATVARDMDAIRSLFAAAVRWKVLRDNPCAGIAKPKPSQRQVVFLEPDEQRRLVEACGNLDARAQARTPFLQPLVILALNTGMRRGELFNLRWRDVDFANRRISVRNTDTFTTKSGKDRVVGLNDSAVRALRAWEQWFVDQIERAEKMAGSRCALKQARAATRLALLRRGAPRPEGLVFPSIHVETDDGEPKPLTNVDSGMERAGRVAGINRRVGLHVLRHTFAVNLCRAGVPIYKISKALGHADTRTTELHYLRFAKDEAAEVVNLLDQL